MFGPFILGIHRSFHIFLMFQLEDTQARQDEQTFPLLYMFYAEGSLIVSKDSKD